MKISPPFVLLHSFFVGLSPGERLTAVHERSLRTKSPAKLGRGFFHSRSFLYPLLILPILAFFTSVQADIIFQKTVTSGHSSGAADGVPDTAYLSLGLDSPNGAELFEEILQDPLSVGKIFRVTSESDPDFDVIAATITDGEFTVQNLIRVKIDMEPGGSGSTGFTEPLFFYDDGSGSSGIDLSEYRIESISMRIDGWETPWQSPSGGNFDIGYTVTFFFEGSPVGKCETPQILNYPSLVTGEVATPIDFRLYDMDGDADADVLFADEVLNEVAWVENEGGGEFGSKHVLTTALTEPYAVAMDDLDGDLEPDVVEVSRIGPEVAWQKGLGNGQFAAKQTLHAGFPHMVSVDTGDIDGDLDIDIVVATAYGPVWLENDAMDFSTDHAIGGLPFSNSARWQVIVGDLDGDLDLDVVSRETGRELIYVSINSGGGTFAPPVSINTAPLDPHQFDLVDLDGNGSLDILVALESFGDRRISYYPNNGNGAFGAPRILAQTTSSEFSMVRGAVGSDLDRDGDMDVVAITSSGEQFWIENFGQSAFGPRNVFYERGGLIYKVVTGDIDGDRDEDVLAVDWEVDRFVWFRNTLDPSLISKFTLSSESIESGGQSELSWDIPDAETISIAPGIGDVSGLSTVQVSPVETTTYTLTATRGALVETEELTLLVDEVPQISSFAASDEAVLAGEEVQLSWEVNGAETISITGVDPVIGQSARVIVNSATTYTLTATNSVGSNTAVVTVDVGLAPVINTFSASPTTVTRNATVTLSWDVTGADDLKIDFGVGSVAAGPVYIPAAGPRNYTLTASNEYGATTAQASVSMANEAIFDTPVVINNSINFPGQPACGDFDGDDDLDIAVCSLVSDYVGWHENDGSGSFGSLQTVSSAEGRAIAVVAADFTGDDVADLALAGLDAGIVFFANDGTGQFGPRQELGAGFGRTIEAVDFDGDDDIDLCVVLNEEIQWFENTDGAGTFAPGRFIDDEYENIIDISCADLDGDGDIDIVASEDFGPRMQWYENRGDGTIIRVHLVADDISRFRNVTTADLDQDGDEDIIANLLSDGVFHFLNDGCGNFASRVLISAAVGSEEGLHVVDINNDSNPDVLVGGRYELAWFENNGNANFGGKQTIINSGTSQDFWALETCDLDGDGSIDLIAASEDADRVQIALNLSDLDLSPVFPLPPPDITAGANVGGTTAIVTWNPPVAIDDHTPNPLVEQVSGSPPGSSFSLGTETIVYRATDSAGKTTEVSFDVIVIDKFAIWETTHGLSDTVLFPNRDTDLEGISDFLEFAFGLNPRIGEVFYTKVDQAGLPSMFIETVTDGMESHQHAAIHFTRRIENLGLRYTVDSSTDLVNWAEPDSEIEEIASWPSGDGITEIVHVRHSVPIGDAPDGRLHLRVRVKTASAD